MFGNNPGGRESGFSSLERLAFFGAGIGFGGLVFCAILSFYLFPRRPALPDPALGYTHLFNIKSHTFYGTWFEYFATTYGFFVAWGFGLVCSLFASSRGINLRSAAYNWHVFPAALISMPFYAAIWWVFP
jgi:hypothetical protein